MQSGSTWAINGSTFYYAAYKRMFVDYSPILSCPSGDIYPLKIGLITIDEQMMAGGNSNIYNNQYYLYNGQSYWTMTPTRWHGDLSLAQAFYILPDGTIYGDSVTDSCGLRPVINLIPSVTFNEGSDGTKDKPFIVEGA